MTRQKNLLEELNKDFIKRTTNTTIIPEAVRVRNEKFKELDEIKNTEKDITISINHVSIEGVFSQIDTNDITYSVNLDEIKPIYPNIDKVHYGLMLGCNICAKIKSLDPDNSKVYLHNVKKESFKGTQLHYAMTHLNDDKKENESESQEKKREELTKLLDQNIKKHKSVTINGIVVEVKRGVAYADIYGLGLIAGIPAIDYKRTYTTDMRELVSVGDEIKGDIYAYKVPAKGEKACYCISTKKYIKQDIVLLEKQVNVGDILTVKCIKKPKKEGREFYWGSCPLLPGIDIMCDYSTTVPKEKVYVSEYYIVRVKNKQIEKDNAGNRVLHIKANTFGIVPRQEHIEGEESASAGATPLYTKNAIYKYQQRNERVHLTLPIDIYDKITDIRKLYKDSEQTPIAFLQYSKILIQIDLSKGAAGLSSYSDAPLERIPKDEKKDISLVFPTGTKKMVARKYYKGRSEEELEKFPFTLYIRQLLTDSVCRYETWKPYIEKEYQKLSK